ncbi:MAG: CobD/CbiB family cobalamin biosynthesis protein, partial [Acidimicrobiia bacterium]
AALAGLPLAFLVHQALLWLGRRRPTAARAASLLLVVTCLGGRTLERRATELAGHAQAADLAGARALLPWLVGREPQALDLEGAVRAGLESVAENLVDAQVATFFWWVLGGVPLAVAHRAVNTLDAMVGTKTPRYRRFGWAAARADDLANFIPARLTALGVALLAPTVGGSPRRCLQAVLRDAGSHPSPNAGVAEAAFAGALGVRLGGRTVYPCGVEDRPVLGEGTVPTAADLLRAVRLARRVGAGAALGAALGRWG